MSKIDYSGLKGFKDYMTHRDKSSETIIRYMWVVNEFVNKFHSDIGDYKRHLAERSDGNHNSCIMALKCYYKYLGEPIDPELFNVVRVRDSRRYLIPVEIVQAIVDDLKPHHRKVKPTYVNIQAWRNYCIVGLLAYTGIRNTQLRYITAEDIDYENNRIFVYGIKREKAIYVYPIPKLLHAIDIYSSMAGFSGKERLFKMSRGSMSNLVMELTGYRPKDFRTTFAVEYTRKLRDSGKGDLRKVQKALGHSSVVSTEIYLSLLEETENNSAEVGLYER